MIGMGLLIREVVYCEGSVLLGWRESDGDEDVIYE